ncbi:13391_t:CDS:2, partial [Gigaspora margarita]
MSSELELLKQCITELEAKNDKLEAENAELRKENTEIRNLRIKLSVSDAEIAELKRRNVETLRWNAEYNERRDTENAKLRARIEEIESEFGDRITKVEQKQTLNESNTGLTIDNRTSSSKKILDPMTKISAGQNSHRKKGAENIVQMIADGIKNDAQTSNKAIRHDVISIESLNQNSSTDSLLSLAQLFDKADDAEYGAIRANQEEILR